MGCVPNNHAARTSIIAKGHFFWYSMAMAKILLVLAGGGIGSLLRYGASGKIGTHPIFHLFSRLVKMGCVPIFHKDTPYRHLRRSKYGTAHVNVYDVRIYRKIMGWLQAVYEYNNLDFRSDGE